MESHNAKFFVSSIDTGVTLSHELLILDQKPGPNPNPNLAMSDCYIQAVPFFIAARYILRLMLYLQQSCAQPFSGPYTRLFGPSQQTIWLSKRQEFQVKSLEMTRIR